MVESATDSGLRLEKGEGHGDSAWRDRGDLGRPAWERAMIQLRAALGAARHYPLPMIALIGLAVGLVARYGLTADRASNGIFIATLVIAGLPVVLGTARGMCCAAISLPTSWLLSPSSGHW
jgi:hypothetical protein